MSIKRELQAQIEASALEVKSDWAISIYLVDDALVISGVTPTKDVLTDFKLLLLKALDMLG